MIGIVSSLSNKGLMFVVNSYLLQGQFEFLVIAAEHISCPCLACTTLL